MVNKVTLCGSTKFKKAYQEWNARLTLAGNLVYSVVMWDHSKKIEPTPEQKELLDKIHLQKIDNSDEIFVLDVDGYVGDSTNKEVQYALSTGKNIRFLSEEFPDWTEEDCIYCQE